MTTQTLPDEPLSKGAYKDRLTGRPAPLLPSYLNAPFDRLRTGSVVIPGLVTAETDTRLSWKSNPARRRVPGAVTAASPCRADF